MIFMVILMLLRKSIVLGMSHIQIDGWMNPAVRTTYDFIKNKEFRCEVENYSTPWESARSCANSDLGTIVTFEDNDDCFHSKPRFNKKIDGENKNWCGRPQTIFVPFCIQNGSRKYNELKARWTAKTFCKSTFAIEMKWL